VALSAGLWGRGAGGRGTSDLQCFLRKGPGAPAVLPAVRPPMYWHRLPAAAPINMVTAAKCCRDTQASAPAVIACGGCLLWVPAAALLQLGGRVSLGGCGAGFTHPVEDLYLEDVLRLTGLPGGPAKPRKGRDSWKHPQNSGTTPFGSRPKAKVAFCVCACVCACGNTQHDLEVFLQTGWCAV